MGKHRTITKERLAGGLPLGAAASGALRSAAAYAETEPRYPVRSTTFASAAFF
jgi:hypothetical protein